MADIAAVLRKTIDGLPSNSPAIREKVYAKARATILTKLEARDPKPDQAAIDRQLAGVDKVIAAVEADYAFREQVDSVLGEETPATPPAPEAAPSEPAAETPEPTPSASEPPAEAAAPAADAAPPKMPQATEAPVVGPEDETPQAASGAAPGLGATATGESAVARNEAGPRRLVWVIAVLLVGGAAGYAAWLNQDSLLGGFDRLRAQLAPAAEDGAQPPAPPAASEEQQAQSETQQQGETALPEDTPSPAGGQPPKLTQRLLEDGSETDPGPAGGEAGLGEGTSVAQATQPDEAPSPPADAGTGDNGETQAEAPAADGATDAQPSAPAIAIGQRAIFYEERTPAEEGTAGEGNVVWTLVQESPGGDAPLEPAIRAELTYPERQIGLRMTIRRNADATLPASHIIELVFDLPEGFSGGAIDEVLRVTFKDAEASTGNPLLGIPAKIADNFFLVALTDGTAEVEANTTLMRRQKWIDIPVVYRTGRRALLTMEKGIPGDQVFDQVIKAWEAAPPAGG